MLSPSLRPIALLGASCLLAACVAGQGAVAAAATMEDAGLVDVRQSVPDIAQDIRYAGSNNFVGVPVDGYGAARCYLLRPAAAALARVESALRRDGLRLRVFDCYRPARAVLHFLRWTDEPATAESRRRFHPALERKALLGGYIAPVSGHSRGATVDLTLLRCAADGSPCEALDMGTEFDFFDARANTDSPAISNAQKANRHRLRQAMEAEGFRNYPMEWWHYTLPLQAPTPVLDIPITADAPAQ